MGLVPIRKTHNEFLSSEGYVIKIQRGVEVKVFPRIDDRYKRPYIKAQGKMQCLLNLMVSHFLPDVKAIEHVSFKIGKDNRIHLNSIKVKKMLSEWISEDEETVMRNFKCAAKAHSANARAADQITALQVYLSLKVHEFKCTYCGGAVKEIDWHLEHYAPLSRGGTNRFENLVPSCSMCNIMKGSLQGGQFFNQCKRIVENFRFQDENTKPTTS